MAAPALPYRADRSGGGAGSPTGTVDGAAAVVGAMAGPKETDANHGDGGVTVNSPAPGYRTAPRRVLDLAGPHPVNA
ncbi:hypothetical protein SUDANB174_07010 [Streptomyces sp. enrichment culture]